MAIIVDFPVSDAATKRKVEKLELKCKALEAQLSIANTQTLLFDRFMGGMGYDDTQNNE